MVALIAIQGFTFKYFCNVTTSNTECVNNLDKRSKMIIFMSILTTFKASFVFSGSWGSSKNRLEPKT